MKASGKMAYLPGSRNPEVVTMLCIWLPLAMAQDSGRGMLSSLEGEEGYLRTRAARSVRFLDSFPLNKEERSKVSLLPHPSLPPVTNVTKKPYTLFPSEECSATLIFAKIHPLPR